MIIALTALLFVFFIFAALAGILMCAMED
jgi:hypothetical protein